MLKPLIAGTDKACFGVTEPDAGLDTASIKTFATKVTGGYRVTGRKIWTSSGQVANKIVLLTRTTPKEGCARPTDGMTLFYTDLDHDQTEVRRIPKMGRNAVDSNATFIDDYFIPDADRIGEEGKGFNYILHSLNPERILVGCEAVGLGQGALAMTEPGAGSDAKAIRTKSELRDGEYVINGQKTYISNGQHADIIVLACKTDPHAGARGVSLIAVEADQPGFERGRNLDKIGLKAQDTSELFFADVRAPVAHRLGGEGEGFSMLMTKLAQERLTIGVKGIAACEAAIRWTVDYVQERDLFGQKLGDMQNTQFSLAQVAAEVSQGRVLVDWGIRRFLDGKLSAVDASKIKLLITELNGRVVDTCLQFFGGYGYMTEYPISQAFVDARISRIAGGANEVMRQIISRDLFRGRAPS